jgi:ubiquinone/menaquinone biosynthesis C-methylase UbiE
MLARVLEPEVMDTPEDAADYDTMDHSAVNRIFASDFLSLNPDVGSVLDVGTGTAQIPIELARQNAAIRIVAIDLSEEMLKLARRNVAAAGFQNRITATLMDASGMIYHPGAFTAVVSNSIIHHIPDPRACLAGMVRLCHSGGRLFVRDLFRPDSKTELDRLVNLHAAGANDHQRQLFADSLHAALTVDEVRALVVPLGFAPGTVQATSDRHWTWSAVKDQTPEI